MYENLELKVFFGNASAHLAPGICQRLGIEPGEADIGRFENDEVRARVQKDVRGKDVFIVSSTEPPAEHILEILILADAVWRSSAARITLVIPYLSYNRQERKGESREPISAKVIIDVLRTTGVDRVMLLDLHAEATISMFDKMRQDHLYASSVTIPYIRENLLHQKNLLLAAPDVGAGKRIKAHARRLGTDFVYFDKTRPEADKVDPESIVIIGDVKERNLLFDDDMINTAGTLLADAEAAKEAGAGELFACAAHGLFSGNAIQKLDEQNLLKKIIVTDSIYQDPDKIKTQNIEIIVLTLAPLLAEAIRRVHEGRSISELIL